MNEVFVTYTDDQDVLDGGHIELAVFGGDEVKLWKYDFLFRNFVRKRPYISLVDTNSRVVSVECSSLTAEVPKWS